MIIVSCCHVSEATAVIIGCGSYNKSNCLDYVAVVCCLPDQQCCCFWGYETGTLSIVQVLTINQYVMWMCATCVNLCCVVFYQPVCVG